ncbi:MAG: choice-of-anchor Q domain-containing protein [Acidimicrobiia bacterium]
MGSRLVRRAAGALAVVAMALVPIAYGAFAAPVGAAGTVNVATAGQLATAWADTSNTRIVLTADIQLSDASGTCFGENPFRAAGGSGITVDGQGLYGITSTCELGRLLVDDGAEAVTLTGLTHFDGGTSCGAGGGLYTNGSATITNVHASDNAALGQTCPLSQGVDSQSLNSIARGGALYSGAGNLTVTGSSFSNNHADVAGGAVAVLNGNATVTGTTFSDNTVGVAGDPGPDNDLAGGALYVDGTAGVSGSTFTGNHFAGQGGDECENCSVEGGALWAAFGAIVDTSTFTENAATCVDSCGASGGAIYVESTIAQVQASTFTDNTAQCLGNCSVWGGAVSTPESNIISSTFTGNSASCAIGSCGNVGGALASGDTTVEGSTFTNNDTSCQSACDASGGAIAAGAFFSAKSEFAPDSVHAAGKPLGDEVEILTSTFTGNTATATDNAPLCDCNGGAVYAFSDSTVTIDSSTFADNTALFDGGALSVRGEPTVTIHNSTVTANDSGFNGALDLSSEGLTAELAYNTIVANTVHEVAIEAVGADARAAFVTPPSNLSVNSATFFGNIIALPATGTPNCLTFEDPTSQGYNWSDDTSCGLTNATDEVAAPNDPLLNPLGFYGGPTPTMLPLTPKNGGAISPVIDAIPVAACQTGIAAGIANDQRRVLRPQLVGCDIGSVEVTQEDYQVEAAAVIQPKFTG